jgi:glutathione S-transferase
MIELYHNDMSVCAQKVRFALVEKKLAWDGRHLNLRAGDQQKPEYLKLNPNAVVPTLVDNGVVIIESTVINEYLNDAYPEPRLKPTDAAWRAHAFMDQAARRGRARGHQRGQLGDRVSLSKLAIGMEALEEFHKKMPDPVKREKSWENVTKGVESRFFAEAIKRFDRLLADMEVLLADSPWLAGKDFSLADIG